MGAFNLLIAEADCPNCGQRGAFEVQFKYGDTWQHQYLLGQTLKWGGNDIGQPGRHRVVIEAIGGPCPHCARDNLEFDVFLEDDRIVELKPVGVIRESASKEGFVVLEK